MPFEIDRSLYARMYGPTVGDRVRLGDTRGECQPIPPLADPVRCARSCSGTQREDGQLSPRSVQCDNANAGRCAG